MSKVEQEAGGDAENLEYVKAMAQAREAIWGAHKVVEAKGGAMCEKEKHAHCFVVRCTCWCHKRK